MRYNRHRRAKLEDVFATAYDTDIWSEVTSGTGAVSISSGELKLNCPANNDIAGLVTKTPYFLRNCDISVAVDVATDSPARAGIVLARTKVTTSNPESENDVLYVCLDQVNDKVLAKSNVDGGGAKTLVNASWTDGDGSLKIDIEPDGYYVMFEDSTEKFVGSVPFTETQIDDIFKLYIYLYCIGLTGTLGYALLDNFVMNYDESPDDDIPRGNTVRRWNAMQNTAVFGRLLDTTGTQDFFETDHAYTETPTQRIVLSRNCKRLRLEEVRTYMNSANAVTSGLAFYEAADADDEESYSHLIYKTGDNTSIAKTTLVQKGINDTPLPAVMNLERPGQVWFNQDWSGAPGDTSGFITIVGREVE